MSRLSTRRGKTVGFTAVTAVALSMLSGAGAAQAAPNERKFIGKEAAIRVAESGKISAKTSRAAEQELVDSLCSISSYAPNKIVLGASAVTKTFSVKVTGCTLDAWLVVATPFTKEPESDSSGFAGHNYAYYWDDEDGVEQFRLLKPKISLSPRNLTNADAGKNLFGTYVEAAGAEDPESTEDLVVRPAQTYLPLTLQRRASFGKTFNASPEPVKKGKKITIKGTLSRVNWNGAKTLKYVGYPKAKAQVQFKADGASAYKTVKTVTTGTGGKVSTTVKASKTGRWRLVFAGISTTAAATSKSDAVKVK